MTTAVPKHDISVTRAYYDKLVALLGRRDPLDVLASTPDVIGKLIASHKPETLRKRPFPDRWTWTPLEIIGHLLDGELVYGFRIRLILCEERPTILGMDQEKWVAGQDYNGRDPKALLADFRAARNINLSIWRNIRPDQFARVGVHNERGEESLGQMIRMHAGHDLSHIDQLTRYLAVIGP